MHRAVLFAVLLLLPGLAQAAAAGADPRTEYWLCLAQAKTKPEQGWEDAIAWQSLGGGDPARHCAAVALIGLGKYGEAATRLETLGNESVQADAVRAEMFAQAGQAWLMEGKVERAHAAQSAGLILAPDDPDLLLDRSVTLAQAKNYREAVHDLNRLLALQPNRIEALVLRASALRYLDQMPIAERDIAYALELDPNYPDALMERGIQRRLKGDDAGARADWLRTIALAPEAPSADTARQNLARMDVKEK